MSKSPNEVDRHVGSRVRMRRMMIGMSQEKLGDALGLTFQQVQKYENGRNRLGASRLGEMARVLEVPVSALFGKVEGIDQADVLALLGARGAMDLLTAYRAIDDGQLRRDLLAVVCTAVRIGAEPFAGSA